MMKNLYITLVAFLVAFTANAQLSGSYTVGGTTPDFPSVAAAIDTLNANGVSGAVTFNIRPATYTGQYTIGNITGASATNTILFRPDTGATSPVVLTFGGATSADNYTVLLKSAKFVQFDSLTIRNTTATFSTVIRFNDTCSNVTFDGNLLEGVSGFTTSTFASVIYDDLGVTNMSENIIFRNNEIKNGSYGMYIRGTSSALTGQQDGWVIENNDITGWYSYSIYSYYNKNIKIQNNNMATGIFASGSARGMSIYYNASLTITGNTFFSSSSFGGYGFYFFGCNSTATARGNISNNIIHVVGARYGFYATSSNFTDIYFNTIVIDGGSFNPTTAYLNLNQLSNFKNNILVNNSNTGVVMDNRALALQPDYNNYYSPGRSVPVVGANSMSVDPLFTSTTDFHISNVQLNGKALSITGITTDVDGDTRPTLTDIGADEFDPDSLDAAVIDVKDVYCAGPNDVLADILNFGLDTIFTAKIRLGTSVNGRPYQYSTYSFNGSIPSGSTGSMSLQNINFLPDTMYQFRVVIDSLNGKPDTVLNNNVDTTHQFSTAIAGIKTIGGVNPDFVDVKSAIDRLTSSGICGTTIFKIRQGTYERGGDFTTVRGVSATDTIVFEADTGITTKPIIYDTLGNTFTFSGVEHVTFRNLSVQNNLPNRAVFLFQQTNRNIRIDSCELRSDTSARPGFNARIISNDRNNFLSGLEVSNSILDGGYYSMYLYGTSTTSPDSNMRVVNNEIRNWYLYGIYAYNQEGTEIRKNNIKDKDVVSLSVRRSALFLVSNDNAIVSNNNVQLSHTTAGRGVYLSDCDGANTSSRSQFINNMVTAFHPAANLSDLVYIQSSNFIDVYHNSMYYSANGSASFTLNLRFNSSLNFRNNIAVMNGSGTAVNRDTRVVSSHNNIYAPGGTTSNIPLFPNEFNLNPFFQSAEDLHVKSIFLNNRGLYIPAVTSDIDGEARSTTPDVGADEFTVDSNDIGIVQLIAPLEGNCGTDSQLVRVLILNNGLIGQSNFPISVDVTGPVTASLTTNYTGTINSATYDTVDVGYINTTVGGKLNFKVWSGLALDSYDGNDTLWVDEVRVDKIPSLPNITNPIVVCSGLDTVITSGSNAKSVEWYDALTNGNLLHVGDSITVNTTTSDTLYVQLSDDYSSSVGALNSNVTGTSNIWRFGFDRGFIFDVNRNLSIDTVTVFPNDSGTVEITVFDKDNNIMGTKQETVFPQAGSKIALGFTLPPGKDYRITANGTAIGTSAGTYGLEYHFGGRYPYRDSDTSMVLKSDNFGGTGNYYFFYDIKISVDGCDAGIGMVPIDTRPTPQVDLGNDTGYCVGTTINLTADATSPGAGQYIWDNGSTSPTRNLTTQGIYSVTATGTNGCLGLDSIEIEEIQQPVMAWSSSRFCDNIGNVQLYSATRVGGVYSGTGVVNGTHFNTSSGPGVYNLNYSYADGMGCVGQISGQIHIDGAPTAALPAIADVCESKTKVGLSGGTPAPGYYFDNENKAGFAEYLPSDAGLDTIYYVGFAQNGCKDTVSRTINVLSAPIPTLVASDTLCENEPAITLLGSPATGTYSGPGVTGNSFDPSVALPGFHYVYYKADYTNGCSRRIAKGIEVLEKPNVVFTPLLDVCEGTGDYTIVRGTPAGGTLSGGFVDDVASTFDVDAAGIGSFPVTYKYEDTYGCSEEITQNVVVKQAPFLNLGGNQQICGSNALELDAKNLGAFYFWSTGATSRTISVTRSGEYGVRVNLNGCITEDTIQVSYKAICVGQEEFVLDNTVSLFPNPVQTELTVAFVSGDYKSLRVFDAIGNLVLDRVVANADTETIDVTEFAVGLYTVELIGEEKITRKKFQVSK